MVISLESPSVLFKSLGEATLLENGVVTLATHVAALYVVLLLPTILLTLARQRRFIAHAFPQYSQRCSDCHSVVLILADQGMIPRDFANKQLEYLQLGGYCTALSGLYLFKNRKPVSLRNVGTYLLIVAILFSTARLLQVPSGNLLEPRGLPHSHSEVLYESSWGQLDTSQWHQSNALDMSLSGFLQSRGLGNDETLFITIASKKYIESMINFKFALDTWGLGNRYVVLCLDRECVQAADSHNIHAYTRYLMSSSEAGDDWHLPVARIKVIHISNIVNSGLVCSQSR